jgi:hypothetical protein
MLKIDGLSVKLGIGEKYKELEVKWAFLDSVMVLNQDELRVFKKG